MNAKTSFYSLTGVTYPGLVAPTNIAIPTLSGLADVGVTLATTDGMWSGFPTPTLTYQWLRDGSPIAGATATSYTVVIADIGAALSVLITATNTVGPATAQSAPTAAVVNPVLPVNTPFLPVIGGTQQVGSTLNVTNGSWTNSPTSFTYVWLRNGTPIVSATSATYSLVHADAGTVISATVTAFNAFGSSSATALPTSAITEIVSNTAIPVISGTVQDGSLLTVTNGTWLGFPVPTVFTYQWHRTGFPIGGATLATYSLVTADVGALISCTVTASNGSTSDNPTSAQVGPVAAAGGGGGSTGAPIGLLLSLTQNSGGGGPPPTGSNPLGLLLAITQ